MLWILDAYNVSNIPLKHVYIQSIVLVCARVEALRMYIVHVRMGLSGVVRTLAVVLSR